ncbi:hypothetical protein BH11CYA1_BH11CYA1_36290 [soil metagenome]
MQSRKAPEKRSEANPREGLRRLGFLSLSANRITKQANRKSAGRGAQSKNVMCKSDKAILIDVA